MADSRISEWYEPGPDGQLLIGGRSADDLVNEAGDTPLFVYDRAIIDKKITALRTAMPDNVSLHYAVKANPMPEIVAHLARRTEGLDVASAGELDIALDAGAAPQDISFAGPGKRDRELAAAIAAGVTLNIESEGEFDRAARIAATTGARLRAAVRVNPPFDLKGSGMRMGGGAKAFGIDAERVPALLAKLEEAGAEFRGFHIFAGSQNLDASAIAEAQRATLELVARLCAAAPVPPPSVNLGGGFGIPYFPGDTPLDVARIGRALADTLAARPDGLRDTDFILELGRYLVGEAGVYLTRVIDVKMSAGQQFVITDGGLHHQLAASGNFGTVIRRNYPLANASKFAAAATETVNVVGCLCTPLDRLGEKIELPKTEIGDLVAVFMAGAYGRSASPERFLGHPPPLEMVV